MNKKLIISLIMAVTLIFIGNVYAEGGSHWTRTNTYYDGGADYHASGCGFVIGNAYTKVPDTIRFEKSRDFGSTTVAIAYSEQTFKSNSHAFGFKTNTKANGYAGQSSTVFAKEKGSWAYGSQFSGAEYETKANGHFISNTAGKAISRGGGIAIANQYKTSTTKTGFALSAVGSIGKARGSACTFCGRKSVNTKVYGNGITKHGTYVERTKNGTYASAGTKGSAQYEYKGTGETGIGFAITTGRSRINHHRNGDVTASAKSFSLATRGGLVSTGGGVYISNIPTQ